MLLDFGLAEELSPEVRQHFISFLHCIARGANSGKMGPPCCKEDLLLHRNSDRSALGFL